MKISQALSKWYRANKRDLPWRKSQDPYKIWISEIMLQQTTVRVVIPYFEKFIKSFPTVKALANATEEKVLSHWSGLGYYSRAKNLHKAAKKISAQKYFPRTYIELLELSGIGPYTAAAIASIAFNEEVPTIDGNVIRVITRLFDISHDVNSRSGKEAIAHNAAVLIKNQNPSEHNQAMMELGATICLPQNPMCILCPVNKNCQSFKAHTMNQRPVKQKVRKQEPWLWTLYVVKKGNQLALVKNSNGTPWLKNTWVLPGEAKEWNNKTPPLCDFKHSITHHKIFVKIQHKKQKDLKNPNVVWASAGEMKNLGVSSIVQKVLNLLDR
ncbi:MAG: A/G-specific adenine glycosylase [Oligoflexia bacterium]|nr:A/G-specific adenine glycosylase [Oligoflexia bacterium]